VAARLIAKRVLGFSHRDSGYDVAAMSSSSSSPRSHTPRRIRWLMNAVGIAALGWTAYCLYAWGTHSGIWRIMWNRIASHQRAVPDPLNVAFIAWGLGLSPLLLVGWPLLQLFRRGVRSA
jgi:hypothetical protein